MHKRITQWLGNDDGERDGLSGYGWQVGTEDHMVSLTRLERPDHETETEHEFFIMRDLFPQIRAAMDRIDARFRDDPEYWPYPEEEE